MRISRAIGRVKRQAKQGMAGLGEGLQSSVVPRPLRGAARRLAELLGANKPTSRARKDPPRPHAAPAASAPAYQPQVVTKTPTHVTFTGTDSGVEPNDEPRDDTPVDPRVVGATPTYNATPIEVAPVEVTPIDATPVDATPIEIAPAVIVGPADDELASSDVGDTEADVSDAKATGTEAARAQRTASVEAHAEPLATQVDTTRAEPGDAKPAATKKPSVPPKAKAQPRAGNGNGKKRAAGAVDDATSKEKVAPSGEAAKTLARSGSGGAKKRSGSRADTSKKK